MMSYFHVLEKQLNVNVSQPNLGKQKYVQLTYCLAVFAQHCAESSAVRELFYGLVHPRLKSVNIKIKAKMHRMQNSSYSLL